MSFSAFQRGAFQSPGFQIVGQVKEKTADTAGGSGGVLRWGIYGSLTQIQAPQLAQAAGKIILRGNGRVYSPGQSQSIVGRVIFNDEAELMAFLLTEG